MRRVELADLQRTVRDKEGFTSLFDFRLVCMEFLHFLKAAKFKPIVCESQPHYIFYQYSSELRNKITRPLNTNLFYNSAAEFNEAFRRVTDLLATLEKYNEKAIEQEGVLTFLERNSVNKVIYTIQQSIGCISDSLPEPNQARKRVGDLFGILMKQIIQAVGLKCESRTVKIPVYNTPGMKYELDLVFSHNTGIIASETQYVHPKEVVGSVKVTSKDRIDKIFLDKFMLSKLLKRDIPFIAIFLHDVQRNESARSLFNIQSTFKTNHFLGYTMELNKLDGVYYVDPRPEMITNELLREQISNFQKFLTEDLWKLPTS